VSAFRYSPNRLAHDIARSLTTMTPPPLADVYLLRRRPLLGVFWDLPDFGLLHRDLPPMARLELTDQTVRCTLIDKSGHAGWLARRLQVPDLKKRLKTGQQVTVFEFPRNGYEITWPEISLGTLCEIRQGPAQHWVISFTLPADYENFDVFRYFNAFRAYQTRGIRRQWRRALDPGAVTSTLDEPSR
jgi:hypothetical protein